MRPSTRSRLHGIAAGIALLTAAAAPAAAPAASLTIGVNATGLPYLPAAEQPAAAANIGSAGASIVRVPVRWSDVAPTAPPDRSTARDPAWTGYRFERLDATVRALAGAGLRPLLYFEYAPSWAEGPHRASGRFAPAGTWKPSPSGLGDFARAVADRYDGRGDDAGRTLPAVRDFQIWNEPNLGLFLTPQVERGRVTSIDFYRRLLNAGYRGVKAAQPGARVLAASLAPYGDYPPLRLGGRVAPVRFARRLLCLDVPVGGPRCPERARFDVFGFNAYPFTPGAAPARRDDVSIAVARARLGTLLRAAVERRTVTPATRKPLWLTETSWSSAGAPGATAQRQVASLAGALYQAWRNEVPVVLWWRWRDDPGTPTAFERFGGLFTPGPGVALDTPKPALRAMRFPLVAVRRAGRQAVWGRAPRSGLLRLERRVASGWATITRRQVRAGDVVVVPVPPRSAGRQVRARVGGEASIVVTIPRQGARR